jgi:hypothetical protein
MLTAVLDEGNWSASCPGFFKYKEKALGSHCAGSWLGPTAGVGSLQMRKSFVPAGI